MSAAERLAPTASDSYWRACPVCDCKTSTPFVSFKEVEFCRCADCGTIYKSHEVVDLRPKEFYEQNYFQGRKSAREKRFEHRVRKCMRQIRWALAFQPQKRLLDIGCSLGYVMEAAQRLGLQAAGSDISEYAVKTCRERGYRAEVGTLDKQPFAGGEFDLIMMKHVLEHTPAPRVARAEVTRILQPGGMVVVLCPAQHYFKSWLFRRSYRSFRPDDLGMQHYIYYSAASLRLQLEKAGFEVLASSKAFFRKHLVRGPLSWLFEATRFAVLRVCFAVTLPFQHEVLCIARRA